MELPPEPTAIHIDPFQNTLFACVVKTVLPSPVHVSPFVEVASEFRVPDPAETQRDPLLTTSYPAVE
jgi:hypothetical protein